MSFPCARCGSHGGPEIREALVNANPSAARCVSCGTPVDGSGKSLEQGLGPAWVPAPAGD